MMGYVESRVGVSGGTFIREATLDDIIEPMTRLLNTYKKQEFFLQIVEVRIIFESATAKLAARRRDNKDLEVLDETLTLMKDEIAHGGIGLEGDRRFHVALSKAAHNEILIRFADLLEDLLLDARKATLELPGIPEESLEDHCKIIEAIKKGSEKEAVAQMKAHLRKAHDKAANGQVDFEI